MEGLPFSLSMKILFNDNWKSTKREKVVLNRINKLAQVLVNIFAAHFAFLDVDVSCKKYN